MSVKHPPESAHQASSWASRQRLALAFGLCPTDASRLAWGLSEGGTGFTHYPPPCPACARLLARFPRQKPNGWRVPAGGAHLAASWADLSAPQGLTPVPGAPDRPGVLIPAP